MEYKDHLRELKAELRQHEGPYRRDYGHLYGIILRYAEKIQGQLDQCDKRGTHCVECWSTDNYEDYEVMVAHVESGMEPHYTNKEVEDYRLHESRTHCNNCGNEWA